MTVSDPNVTALTLELLRDDGAVAYLNGTEVVSSNMPAIPIVYLTRAASGIAGLAETTWHNYDLDPAGLVTGTNTLAVEIHQSSTASSDTSFDLHLHGLTDTPPSDTPPTQPTDLAATLHPGSPGTVDLSWSPSTDDSGSVLYDVYRATPPSPTESVITTTSLTAYTDTTGMPARAYTFWVVARDPSGNENASDRIDITTPPALEGQPVELIPAGAVWRYLADGTDQGAAWRQSGFNDTPWASGPAQLGYGDGDEATPVPSGPPGNHFITTYYRRTFFLDAIGSYDTIIVDLVRDDGAIVYLNGTELVRSNMPQGSVGYITPASATAVGADESTFHHYELPRTGLASGTNVVAVEVHQSSAASSDTSFDLRLEIQDAPPVAQPLPPIELVDAGSVWRYVADGSNQGTEWRVASFDDASWPSGPAELGYGDGDEATQVPSGPIGNRHITTYFRHHFNVTDPGQFTTLVVDFKRDDGGVIYLNGTELIRDNMPVGPIGYLTAAASTLPNAEENVFAAFEVPSSAVVPGDNVLVVEIHQASPTSSDISFDLHVAGIGCDAVPFADLRDCNMAFRNLWGIDLTGINLEGNQTVNRVRFDRSNLTDANLSGISASRPNFTDATLVNVDLSGAGLSTMLTSADSDFTDASFANAIASSCGQNTWLGTFVRVDFSGFRGGCNTFLSVNADDASFVGAVFDGVTGGSARRADFTGARIETLIGDFTDAVFRDFISGSGRFNGFTMNGIFDGADFTGATLRTEGLVSGSYRSAIFTNASFSEFVSSPPTGFVNSDLTGADLTGLVGTDFGIFDSDLTDATVVAGSGGFTLVRVNTTNANFTGTPVSLAEDVTWSNTICPDGTNSDANPGATCIGHLDP